MLAHTNVSAAMFSTFPGILQENSKNVKIIFDADQSGVEALKKATTLYAHIGVTLQSAPTEWVHIIGTWTSNTDNKRFIKNGSGLRELSIVDIRTYFGINEP